ncbi:hypothetical protein GYA37_00735 [candidate division WWE3 bacterium]|uniref:Uncharacterized protein n=1 Tax=candidate division WWE3 bacterium TaxID=2053526 RepID=A0A7X9E6H4_UNCKA|nr:hypothetical protein [candidate division WWE3 bacterium]
MTTNSKRTTLILIPLLILFSLSYINFQKYQPKILRKIEEVKGISSINTDDVPYPSDAVKIGFYQTPKSKQTTFRTYKTQEEIQEFYRNIYSGKAWKIVNEKILENTSTVTYQKEKEVITIVITPEGNDKGTIVSIETIVK